MFEKNGVVWEGIDEQYKSSLRNASWSSYYKGNPFRAIDNAMLYLSTREKVLAYAGDDVCVNPLAFNVNNRLDMQIGSQGIPFPMDGMRKLDRLMSPKDAYRNAYKVAMKYGFQLCLGFYMDHQGMWRKHAWCLDNGLIIETTCVQYAYFGYVISGNDLEDYKEKYV